MQANTDTLVENPPSVNQNLVWYEAPGILGPRTRSPVLRTTFFFLPELRTRCRSGNARLGRPRASLAWVSRSNTDPDGLSFRIEQRLRVRARGRMRSPRCWSTIDILDISTSRRPHALIRVDAWTSPILNHTLSWSIYERLPGAERASGRPWHDYTR